VLLATHLLDDVQQVCDNVVMIDGGSLVVAGATEGLVQRTGTVMVDVGTRGGELVTALIGRGLHAAPVNDIVEVTIQTDADVDAIRDAIAELELPLHRLSNRLRSLDDVFVTAARRP
jgi:ABC-2 type transport system ATP-binding protein